jgi:serine protease
VALGGSSRGDVVGTYVVCGLGKPEDFPVSVRGKIALIKRGDITFNEKVRNAEVAGATGVVIYNKDETDFRLWTLLRPDCDMIEGCDDPTHSWPVVLAISNADGQRLAGDAAQTVDMGAWFDDYTIMNGTSMAAPHVSGAIALVWSLAPNATADRVRDVILSTATDLGPPGFDTDYAFGLINAYKAAVRLAPSVFKPDPSPRVPPEHPGHP